MNQKWYSFKNLKQNNSDEISAEVLIEKNSPWFDGHFPGMPVYPGIAQLSIIFDLIKILDSKRNQTLLLSELKRVRFKQLIKPGDNLKITALRDIKNSGIFKFTISIDDEIACRGNMQLRDQYNYIDD